MEEESSPDHEVKEVLIGKGLAGALQYLRARGDLKPEAVDDWGGRNEDKKKRRKLVGIVDEPNNGVGQGDVLLDRVDEFGRQMTPKEAFRRFSHKFHGKEPGKKKQAKRLKEFQEELKRKKQMNADEQTMDKVRDLQAKLQSPYLVLSGGHSKPHQRQTRNPRNTLANTTTAKKEPMP